MMSAPPPQQQPQQQAQPSQQQQQQQPQQPSSSSPKLNTSSNYGQYQHGQSNAHYHRSGPKNDQAKSPGNQGYPNNPNNNSNNANNNKYVSNGGKGGKYPKQVGTYPSAAAVAAAAATNNKNLFAYYQPNMGANVITPHQLAALNQIYPGGVFNAQPPPPPQHHHPQQPHPHHIHHQAAYVQQHHQHLHQQQPHVPQQQQQHVTHLNNSNYDSNSSSGISTSSALSSTSHTPIRNNPKENGAADSPIVLVADVSGVDNAATNDSDNISADLLIGAGAGVAESNNVVPVKKGKDEQLQAALDPAIISISKSADSIPSSPTIIKSNMIIDSSNEQSKMATSETLANILTAANAQESPKSMNIFNPR